jgi:predicted outer membrane protein
MKMRRYLLGTGVLLMIGMGGACSHANKYEAQRKTGEQVGEAVANKVQFADQFAMLDKKEVALGKLALKKSSNPQVRAFAHQLIENHEQHMASLDSYADASALRLAQIDLAVEPGGVGGSGGPGTVGAKEAAKKSSAQYDEKLDKQIKEFKESFGDLSAKSGSEFDKDFLDQIQKDQKLGTKLTEKGLKEYNDDASLALLLGRNASTFERQLEQAKELRASL